MTVLENAMVGQHCRTRSGIFGAVLGLPKTRREEKEILEKAKDALAFFGNRLTGNRFNQLARELAYADRRRLEIARAMATEPKLLLLDEPAAGMTPKEKEEIVTLIGRLRDERGYAIIVIEHDMPVVKNVSDRVIALDYGKKIAEGTYSEVASTERVIEAYLGARHTESA
jgi:ABC-type branched-subunit amino acid transport system ATPase component